MDTTPTPKAPPVRYPLDRAKLTRLMSERKVSRQAMGAVLKAHGMRRWDVSRVFTGSVRHVPETIVTAMSAALRVPFLDLLVLPDGATEYNHPTSDPQGNPK